MKATEYISVVALVGLLAFKINFAQNHKAANIDASGKVTDVNGSTVATINRHGAILDHEGCVLGKLEGTVLKNRDGEIVGETTEHGHFKDNSGQIIYAVYETDNMNRFKVVDNEGNVIVVVDKAQLKTAGGVAHFIINQKKHEPAPDDISLQPITSNTDQAISQIH